MLQYTAVGHLTRITAAVTDSGEGALDGSPLELYGTHMELISHQGAAMPITGRCLVVTHDY